MGSLAILAPSTPSSENCESMMICMFARRELQGPNSPPTRGSRWMTAGPVQDANLNKPFQVAGAQGAGLADDLSAQGSGLL